MKADSKTFNLAKSFLGKEVTLIIDRPLGSRHPEHDFIHEANYGFVPNTIAADGEELDAYYLGVLEPLEKATGVCIAIAHRKDDDDDKLIVVPDGLILSKEDILKAIHFQERWFDTELVF